MKYFGDNEVLKGVDLTVDTGEVVCLLGPSGSGKTTFLRLINQMETLTGGRIWVGGELIGIEERRASCTSATTRTSPDSARGSGMVFQRFNLFPHMTAMENIIEAPMRVKKVPQVAGAERGGRAVGDGRTVGPGAASTRPSCPVASSSGWRSPGRSR